MKTKTKIRELVAKDPVWVVMPFLVDKRFSKNIVVMYPSIVRLEVVSSDQETVNTTFPKSNGLNFTFPTKYSVDTTEDPGGLVATAFTTYEFYDGWTDEPISLLLLCYASRKEAKMEFRKKCDRVIEIMKNDMMSIKKQISTIKKEIKNIKVLRENVSAAINKESREELEESNTNK